MAEDENNMVENDEIPFLYVGHEIKIKLANKLDPISHISGNDWRLLAEKMGYTTDEVQVIEEQKMSEGRNTLKLFNAYIKKSGNSVQKVLRALKEMKRDDTFKILNDAVPQIRKLMMDREAEENRLPEENSFGQLNEFAAMHQAMFNGNMCCSPVPNGYIPWGPFMSLPYMMQSHVSCGDHQISNNSPSLPRAAKNPKMCHHGSPTNQGCPPNYNQSMLLNGFYLPTSPPINMNARRPAFPDYDSMEVQHPSVYHHGNISMTNGDTDHIQHEEPAPFARTIFKQDGHNMLSLSNDMQISTTGMDYNGDVSESDESDCSPISPNNNTKQMNLGKHMRQDVNKNYSMEKRNRECSKKNVKTETNASCSSFSGLSNQMKSLSTDCDRVAREHSESSDNSGSMKKCSSVPHDMKPAEYIKVYNVKVFVTYSKDSKKCVLNLCSCIEKNGFYCYADVDNKQNGRTEDLKFCKKKFLEADFVLVCCSNEYRSDIKEENNLTPSNGLHSKYIYQMMYEEYKRHDNTNKRFVPIVLEGTSQDDIPSWMSKKTAKYLWPSQYKDLLWMLSKPEDRVSRHRTQNPD